ncbi:MAG: response regulator transcription factor [Oscillospiraceae bacterium]
MSKLIYIAEDETDIRELLICSLSAFDYRVEAFENGKFLVDSCKKNKPDMVILDVMMPVLDGIGTIKLLKEDVLTKNIAVIMLTAKSGEVDKVRLLDLGADDYIVKPFSILELKSRVNAVFRRCNGTIIDENDSISFADIFMNLSKHTVKFKGEEIVLSKKEFLLLKNLVKAKGSIVSRETLLNEVWGYDFMVETRTLDMHIKTLRKKIDCQEKIITVRGFGYKIGE